MLNDRTISVKSPDSHLTRSYVARNVELSRPKCYHAQPRNITNVPLITLLFHCFVSWEFKEHDIVQQFLLNFIWIYCITPDNISGDLTKNIRLHNSGF